MCDCDLCTRNRRWRGEGITDEWMDYILTLEMDVNYYKVIFDGSWPTGKEILLKALEKYEDD